MATKLVQLENGAYIEVEVPDDKAQPISKRHADRVKASFEQIQPIIKNLGEPIAAAFTNIDSRVEIEKAEIEIGFSFEGEGNIYIVKSKMSATLSVKLIVKPREINPEEVERQARELMPHETDIR